MVYGVIRPWRSLFPCPHQASGVRTFPTYSPRQTTWLLLKAGVQQTPEEGVLGRAELKICLRN